MELKKEKACHNCQKLKPLSAYRPDKYTRDKLTNWCGDCSGRSSISDGEPKEKSLPRVTKPNTKTMSKEGN